MITVYWMKNLTEQTAEQLFGAELRSEADDFIRLNTNTTGEIHENIFSPP